MSLAKGLGGGLPIGALVAFGEAGELWQPGMHGSTFGGNPVSAAAALAVLDTIDAEGLVEAVALRGQQLRDGLADAFGVNQVRGSGLLLGLVLTAGVGAPHVAAAAAGNGVIVNAIGESVIRLAPPLTITEQQVDQAVDGLRRALATVTESAA
jgi:acetylornithine aminotransferase